MSRPGTVPAPQPVASAGGLAGRAALIRSVLPWATLATLALGLVLAVAMLIAPSSWATAAFLGALELCALAVTLAACGLLLRPAPAPAGLLNVIGIAAPAVAFVSGLLVAVVAASTSDWTVVLWPYALFAVALAASLVVYSRWIESRAPDETGIIWLARIAAGLFVLGAIAGVVILLAAPDIDWLDLTLLACATGAYVAWSTWVAWVLGRRSPA